MGTRKIKHKVIVHNNDTMSFSYVTECFQSVLGYEATQAANCANIIHEKGKYAVKTFTEKEAAVTTAEMLEDCGFFVEIVA